MSNNNTFIRKKAHFLSKNQTHGNAIVFDLSLTAYALRLLLALNALPETWEIRQEDIQRRLGFSKDRMRQAMRCAEKSGYLKTKQVRKEGGRFNSNVFEFDLEPSFLSENSSKTHSQPSTKKRSTAHNHCEPVKENQPTENRLSENSPLSVLSMSSSVLKEQTNENDIEALFSGLEKEERKSFVCSLSRGQKEKIESLEKYELSIGALKRVLKYEKTEIDQGLAAFEQYASNKQVENKEALICTAIERGWKPNVTKKDLEQQKQFAKQKQQELIQEKRDMAKAIQVKYKSKLDKNYAKVAISVNENCVFLKINGNGQNLSYLDESYESHLQALENYIKHQL